MTSWSDLRTLAERRLADVPDATPDREAEWILEDVSGLSRAELLRDRDALAPPRALEAVEQMLVRRASGEPLQYILGHWSFRGLDLLVDPRVLIPRPETEWVVECAIEALAAQGVRRGTRNAWTGTHGDLRVVDLGTGSGAIALALAAELPDAEVWATDASADALAVARANVAGCGATRVHLAEGSWFAALPGDLRGHVRLVVSNPPYVGAQEWESLDHVVRDYEPFSALVGGPDGFEAVHDVVTGASEWLEPGGVLVVEMAPAQCTRAVRLALDYGYADAGIAPDLTGRSRALVARKGT